MGLVRNARILMRLSPYMDKIGAVLSMSKSVHSVIQALMLAIQGLNAITDVIPAKEKIWVAIGASAIQGIIGVLNHFDSQAAQ